MTYIDMVTTTGLLDMGAWSDDTVWTAALETTEARRRGSRGRGGGSWVVGLICVAAIVVVVVGLVWLSRRNKRQGQNQPPQLGNGVPPQQFPGQQYPQQQQGYPAQQQGYPAQQQGYPPHPGQQYPQQQQYQGQQQPYPPQPPYPYQPQPYPPQHQPPVQR